MNAKRRARKEALLNYLRENPDSIKTGLPKEQFSALNTFYKGAIGKAKKAAGIPKEYWDGRKNHDIRDHKTEAEIDEELSEELARFRDYLDDEYNNGRVVTGMKANMDGFAALLLNFNGRIDDAKEAAGRPEYKNGRKFRGVGKEKNTVTQEQKGIEIRSAKSIFK